MSSPSTMRPLRVDIFHVRRTYALEPFPDQAIEQIGGIVQTLPQGIRVTAQPFTR